MTLGGTIKAVLYLGFAGKFSSASRRTMSSPAVAGLTWRSTNRMRPSLPM